LKYEELPEIPGIWLDFLSSRLSFQPGYASLHAPSGNLGSGGNRTKPNEDFFRFLAKGQRDSSGAHQSIQRLRQSQCGVVIANLCGSLLGGPMSQIFKCLTAIRVREELEASGISALPLCWVGSACPVGSPRGSVTLLDREMELHRLHLGDSETISFSPSEPLPAKRVSSLLSRVEELGRGTFDAETLEILKAAFVAETTVSSASAHLLTDLMEPWGMVVLDADDPEFNAIKSEALERMPFQVRDLQSLAQKQGAALNHAGYEGKLAKSFLLDFLVQNWMLPVLAYVIDPWEVYSCAAALPAIEGAGMPQPLFWPRASATIADARSRRTLQRYKLSLHQLFSGEAEVTKAILNGVPRSATAKLNDLKREVETRIDDLKAIDPSGKELMKKAFSHRKRILYQLEKLHRLCAAAHIRKEHAVSRQIHRVCSLLAPNRRLQENELAGVQIPLRYSRAGLRLLYEKLNVMINEHQLISMD
jgi:uncharacterized protein YllA (UPF0747 family)